MCCVALRLNEVSLALSTCFAASQESCSPVLPALLVALLPPKPASCEAPRKLVPTNPGCLLFLATRQERTLQKDDSPCLERKPTLSPRWQTFSCALMRTPRNRPRDVRRDRIRPLASPKEPEAVSRVYRGRLQASFQHPSPRCPYLTVFDFSIPLIWANGCGLGVSVDFLVI